MTTETTNTTVNSSNIDVAALLSLDFGEKEQGTAQVANHMEESISHQNSILVNQELIDAAIESQKAIPALVSHLQKLIIAANAMKVTGKDGNSYPHPRALALRDIYQMLLKNVVYNQQNAQKAEWDQLKNSNVTDEKSEHMGRLSLIDKLHVMHKAGMGIVAAKQQQHARLFDTQNGFRIYINGQGIDVDPKMIFVLLMNAKNVQTCSWDRDGAMFQSSNLDGWTMVVTPRQGFDQVYIADLDGNSFAFGPQIRLSCDHWMYTCMAMAVAPAFFSSPKIQSKENQWLNALLFTLFHSKQHICQDGVQLTYFRFMITMKRNPGKNYFNGMLRGYSPEDFKSYEIFKVAHERLVQFRIAERTSKLVVTDEVVVPTQPDQDDGYTLEQYEDDMLFGSNGSNGNANAGSAF